VCSWWAFHKLHLRREADMTASSNLEELATSKVRWAEELAKLRTENDALREENRRFPGCSMRIPATNAAGEGCYTLHVQMDQLPAVIDPRKTVASEIFSERVGDAVFSLLRTKGYFVLTVCSTLLVPVWTIASLLGIYPQFGWATLLNSALLIAWWLIFNFAIVGQLLKTFEFWGLIGLAAVSTGAIMDAVKFEPSRVAASTLVFLMMVSTAIADARPFLKVKNRTSKAFQLIPLAVTSITNWTLLSCYWTGQWRDMRETSIHVGEDVTVNIQSIGFSALATFCALSSKFAWTSLINSEPNRLVLVKAFVAYGYQPKAESPLLIFDSSTPETAIELEVTKQRWADEMAKLRAENDTLRKENLRLTALVSTTGEGEGLYRLHVQVEELPAVIDPRKTVASEVFSERVGDVVYSFHRHRAYLLIRTCLNLLSPVCIILTLLFGIQPELGWFTLLGAVLLLVSWLLFSYAILVHLLKTFDFWVLMGLATVSTVAIMDAVGFSPARTAVCVLLFVTWCTTCIADALPLTKVKHGMYKYARLVFMVVVAVTNWTLLLCWWTSSWRDVHESSIPVGDVVTVHLQSIGFSALTTLSALSSKYVWTILMSKEANQLVLVKAFVAYRYQPNAAWIPFSSHSLAATAVVTLDEPE
jgi:hypothetical protein